MSGSTLDHGLRDRLIDGFRRVGERCRSSPEPGIEEALDLLRGAGRAARHRLRRGADPGAHAPARLEGLGLFDRFDAWAFSDETGWFKPAAEAFAPALTGLGIDDPSRPRTSATTAAPTLPAGSRSA